MGGRRMYRRLPARRGQRFWGRFRMRREPGERVPVFGLRPAQTTRRVQRCQDGHATAITTPLKTASCIYLLPALLFPFLFLSCVAKPGVDTVVMLIESSP